jgi:hypothetical protein
MKVVLLAISTAVTLSLVVAITAQTSKDEQPTGTSAPGGKTKTTTNREGPNLLGPINDDETTPVRKFRGDEERDEIKKNMREIIRERRERAEKEGPHNPNQTASPGATASPRASVSPTAGVSASPSSTATATPKP